MDPTNPTRPKNWRKFGRIALLLLIATVVAGAAGWAASISGRDPSGLYRLAALFGAGAGLLGLIWISSAGTSDATENRTE